MMIAATRSLALAGAAVLALQGSAAAGDKGKFVFTALTPPNGNGSNPAILAGIYKDEAVGWYYTSNDGAAGFVWSAGNYTIVTAVNQFDAVSDNGVAVGGVYVPTTSYTTYDLATGATNTVNFGPSGGFEYTIEGINSRGAIAATQYTTVMPNKKRKTACQPFEQEADGSYTWLAESESHGLAPDGLTDNGVVVIGHSGCSFFKGGSPYSLYRNGKLKKFTISGAQDIDIDFVTGSGFGGEFYSPSAQQDFGFTSTGANLKLMTYAGPPGSRAIGVTAIGPHNAVAGYLIDSSGYYSGFIYADKTYHTINYPKQKSTIITGFSSTGSIIGYFGEGDYNQGFPNEPFIATCSSDKGCLR